MTAGIPNQVCVLLELALFSYSSQLLLFLGCQKYKQLPHLLVLPELTAKGTKQFIGNPPVKTPTSTLLCPRSQPPSAASSYLVYDAVA